MAFVYLDGLSLKVFREGEGIVRETVYVAFGPCPGWGEAGLGILALAHGERHCLGRGLGQPDRASSRSRALKNQGFPNGLGGKAVVLGDLL